MRVVKVVGKREMEKCKIDYRKELLALAKSSNPSYQQKDVLPQNIFVVQKSAAPCWMVKIGDFGTSKRAQAEIEFHTQARTFAYRAPEISGLYESDELISGYDQSVDMWSLGCVAYEIIAQVAPLPKPLTIMNFCNGRHSSQKRDQHKISSDGMDVLKLLIKADPKERLTAESALEAQWILRESSPVLLFRSAAGNGDLETVRLLKAGVNIDTVGSDSWAALNDAAYHGRLAVAKFLVQNEASFGFSMTWGMSLAVRPL
ncbi:hypothetical protein N7532_003946 [Penicillium argentinense]|uniref:Protein kinase domain-containing protein n=1 Tax=Penicillium argentinense TaxID=1131581 RepID=A0A9W9FNX7_9EURO|nr:uncharacterized protein N7532_003946 [Penicillium argentinense]KAJ5103417.1 hypothetical protein N7532_003946 [Penicillium argentinense]